MRFRVPLRSVSKDRNDSTKFTVHAAWKVSQDRLVRPGDHTVVEDMGDRSAYL